MDRRSDFECEFRARRIRVRGTEYFAHKSFYGWHLMGVHLTGVHLMGMHLLGVHLMGMHLMRGSHKHVLYKYLIPSTGNTSCSLGGLWTVRRPIRGLSL